MPAGMFGVGEWVGYVPRNATRILVPPDLPGLSLETVPLPAVLGRGLRKNSPGAMRAFRLALAGHMAEAREELRIACASTSLARYHWWRTEYSRELDPYGIDAASERLAEAPNIFVLAAASAAAAGDSHLAPLAVRQQTYERWSLHVEFAIRLQEFAERMRPHDLLTQLREGDVLPPYAFAAVARYAMDHPEAQLIYGDEDLVDRRGRFLCPRFKPDFSPIYNSFVPYLGRAIYLRAAAVKATSCQAFSEVLDNGMASGRFTAGTVGHVRRVLLTTPVADVPRPRCLKPRITAAVQRSMATIVIPTKDRPDLLGRCYSSLRPLSTLPHEIVVVDNGSTKSRTRSLYRSLRDDSRVRIIDAPGPFNFSALCNRASREARGQMLVFLNDDTEALGGDWLIRLEEWAMRAECGAVGAKLLYPSGRVQHAGLVLGLGGYAAHLESGAPNDDPGHLGMLRATREVAAVTGACLAVEKYKFDAVGGFDERHFPVELGDVDLCLRLQSRGWKSIVVANALLTHRELASRGRSKDRQRRYAAEHRHFRERWGSRLLDDRYFHPAFALNSLRIRLDG